ncbi:MAG: hypothetical protein ACPG32_06140 [Akkermansiaceae bacterium]
MIWKYIAVGVSCLLVGFFTRGILDQNDADPADSTPHEPSQSATSERRGSRSSSRSRSADRQKVDVPRSEDLAAVSGLPRPSDADLIVVPVDLLEKLASSGKQIDVHDDLFSSSGELIEALQISDREKAGLQHAWRQARAKLREIEAANAKSVTLKDGSVQITVPNLKTQISKIGDEFNQVLSNHLGPNRAAAFSGARGLNQAFSSLAGEAIYTVKVEATGDGRWRYKMHQQGPRSNKAWIGDNVPEVIRHLTDAANIRANLNPKDDEEEDEE